MKDPYYFDDCQVLRNKLNIKDAAALEQAESNITAVRAATVDIATKSIPFSFKRLKAIHKHLFEPVYNWAGQPRLINIEKPEKVLAGMSVDYGDYHSLEKMAEQAISAMNKINWKELKMDERAEKFSKSIAAIWKTHAFREGNTRTVMTFAKQFGDAHGFLIDGSLFQKHAAFTRNALVMASIGEYSEYQHLTNIMRDAMESGQKNLQKAVQSRSLETPNPIQEYCQDVYGHPGNQYIVEQEINDLKRLYQSTAKQPYDLESPSMDR